MARVVRFPEWTRIAGWFYPTDGVGVGHALVRCIYGERRTHATLCGKPARFTCEYGPAVTTSKRCVGCERAMAAMGVIPEAGGAINQRRK